MDCRITTIPLLVNVPVRVRVKTKKEYFGGPLVNFELDIELDQVAVSLNRTQFKDCQVRHRFFFLHIHFHHNIYYFVISDCWTQCWSASTAQSRVKVILTSLVPLLPLPHRPWLSPLRWFISQRRQRRRPRRLDRVMQLGQFDRA